MSSGDRESRSRSSDQDRGTHGSRGRGHRRCRDRRLGLRQPVPRHGDGPHGPPAARRVLCLAAYLRRVPDLTRSRLHDVCRERVRSHHPRRSATSCATSSRARSTSTATSCGSTRLPRWTMSIPPRRSRPTSPTPTLSRRLLARRRRTSPAFRSVCSTLVEGGQLSIFTNGWLGHPEYAQDMPAELHLIAVAHYLEALKVQAEAAQIIGDHGWQVPALHDIDQRWYRVRAHGGEDRRCPLPSAQCRGLREQDDDPRHARHRAVLPAGHHVRQGRRQLPVMGCLRVRESRAQRPIPAFRRRHGRLHREGLGPDARQRVRRALLVRLRVRPQSRRGRDERSVHGAKHRRQVLLGQGRPL